MRSDYARGVLSTPSTTTYKSIDTYLKKAKVLQDEPSLKLPPVVGKQVKEFNQTERVVPVQPTGQVYLENQRTVYPSPSTKWASLPTTLPSGGGEYIVDPDQPGKLIRLNEAKMPGFGDEQLLIKRGLPGSLYEVDHIVPLNLGGSNNLKNKMILTKREHDKKTNIQAVISELYNNNRIGLGEARRLALNWADLDDSHTSPSISLDNALKKYEEWNMDPNAGIIDKVADAFQKWGWKDSANTAIEESKKDYYANMEATNQMGMAGALLRGPLDVGRRFINIPAELINTAQFVWNTVMPEATGLEIKKGEKLIEPLAPLSSVIGKVPGHELATTISEFGGALAGETAKFVLGMKVLQAGVGAISKYRWLSSAKKAMMAKAGASKLIKPVTKLIGPFVNQTDVNLLSKIPGMSKVPLFKNIVFNGADALRTAGYFTLYGQMTDQEKNTFDSRLKKALTDFPMGYFFGSVKEVNRSWRSLAESAPIISAGTYALARLGGSSNEEALMEGLQMGVIHTAFGLEARRAGMSPMFGNQEVSDILDKGAKNGLEAFYKGLKFDKNNRQSSLLLDNALSPNATSADIAALETAMLERIDQRIKTGEVTPIGASNAKENIWSATRWLQIKQMPETTVNERALKQEKAKQYMDDMKALATNSAKGTKRSGAAAEEITNEFYDANPEYATDKEITDTISDIEGKEIKVEVDKTKVADAPIGDVGFTVSAKTEPDFYAKMREFINENKEELGEDGLLSVRLQRSPGDESSIKLRNEELKKTGRADEIDTNPQNTILIRGEVGGTVQTLGTLSGASRDNVAETLNKLDMDSVFATIKMEKTADGTWRPVIGETKLGDTTGTIKITRDNWEDSLLANEKIKVKNNSYPEANIKASAPRTAETTDEYIIDNLGYAVQDYPGVKAVSMKGSLGWLVEKAIKDPNAFNVKYSNNPDNPILPKPLVSKIKNNLPNVKIQEIWDAIGDAYQGRRIVDYKNKKDDIIDQVENINNTNLDNVSINSLKGMLNTPMGDLVRGMEPAEGKTIGEAARDQAAALKQTAGAVYDFARGLFPRKNALEMNKDEAARASKEDFDSWAFSKARDNISTSKDLKDAKDLFDAFIQRNMINDAQHMRDRLEVNPVATERVQKDFDSFVKDMDSRLSAAKMQSEIKGKPKTEVEKIVAEIQKKPTVTEEEVVIKPESLEELEIKSEVMKMPTEKTKEVEDFNVQTVEAEAAKLDPVQAIEDDALLRETLLESEKPPLEGEVMTDPENIRDPDIRAEAIVYDKYYMFDNERGLAAGTEFFDNIIKKAKAEGNKDLEAEARKDLKKFSIGNINRRASHWMRDAKGDPDIAGENFVNEFEKIFQKYGSNELTVTDKDNKSAAARQGLKHRFLRTAFGIPRKIFTVTTDLSPAQLNKMTPDEARNSGTIKIKVRDDQTLYPKSPQAIALSLFNKNNGTNIDMIYYDDASSSRGLRQSHIVDALEANKYFYFGQTKNATSAIRALRVNAADKAKIIKMFDENYEDILPQEMQDKHVRYGKVKLDEQTKVMWIFARDIMNMHDRADNQTFLQRAQLYDNKEIPNAADYKKKYNVVTIKSTVKVGDTIDKTFEDWFKNVRGISRDSALELWNKPAHDGDMYITRALANKIGKANGFIHSLNIVKPTITALYESPTTGKVKMLLMKGQIQVMDKKLQSIYEKKIGRKINENDIIATDQNIKFGLEDRLKTLVEGKPIEQPISAQGLRLAWERPHEPSGSFGVSAYSKISGKESGEYIDMMFANPVKDWLKLVRETRYQADGEHIKKTFNEFLDKYHIDIPKHMYSEIQDSFTMGAGSKTHNRRIDNILIRLYGKKVLGGGYLKRDYLKVVPDQGYLAGEGAKKYLQGGNVIISKATLYKMFGEVLGENGKVEGKKDGSLVWKDTQKPVRVATIRYPATSSDNITVGQVYLGENLGIKNLGKSGVVLSHENIHVNKNGDQDGDAVAIVAVGDVGDRIPEGFADILAKSTPVIADQKYSKKREKTPGLMTYATMMDMASKIGIGQQAIENVSAGLRTARTYYDAGIRVEAIGNSVDEPRIIDVYFGNSNKPWRPDGKPWAEFRSPVRLKDVVVTAKNPDEIDIIGKTYSGAATDAGKSDGIATIATEQGVDINVKGFPKSIMYKNLFRETGRETVDDVSVLEVLQKLDKYFQVAHQLGKGDNPNTIMQRFENRDPSLKISASKMTDLEKSLNIIHKLNDAVTSRGGELSAVMRIFEVEGMRDFDPGPDYATMPDLLYQGQRAAALRINEQLGDYSIETLESPGWNRIPKEELKSVILLREQIKNGVDAYNMYITTPKNNRGEYAKWNNIIGEKYYEYTVGARDAGKKVLSEKDWNKALDDPSDYDNLRIKDYTYDDYVNGYSTVEHAPLTEQQWRTEKYKAVRKKMVKNLKTTMDDLSIDSIDSVVHFLTTSDKANVKSHPGYRNRTSSLYWRFDEVINQSPAIAQIYYGAYENYLPSAWRAKLEEQGREIKDFTNEDAKAIVEKYGKMTKSQRQKYIEEAEKFRTEMNAMDEEGGLPENINQITENPPEEEIHVEDVEF